MEHQQRHRFSLRFIFSHCVAGVINKEENARCFSSLPSSLSSPLCFPPQSVFLLQVYVCASWRRRNLSVCVARFLSLFFPFLRVASTPTSVADSFLRSPAFVVNFFSLITHFLAAGVKHQPSGENKHERADKAIKSFYGHLFRYPQVLPTRTLKVLSVAKLALRALVAIFCKLNFMLVYTFLIQVAADPELNCNNQFFDKY